MQINEVIRQKRKGLGLTQEQLAQKVGISVSAVCKWEGGTTYPDINMLMKLARVLKTDMNTLFSFDEELSKEDTAVFLNDIMSLANTEDYQIAFETALEKIEEYPNDMRLRYSLSMVLQGALIMQTQFTEETRIHYKQEILRQLKQVGAGRDFVYAHQANYMLASIYLNEGKKAEAKKIIELLPDNHASDKCILQAKLLLLDGKIEEANRHYEQKLLRCINEMQMPIMQLIRLAVEKKDLKRSAHLVDCGNKIMELFEFWKYNCYLFSFEEVVAKKDVKGTLVVLKPMLEALLQPWEVKKTYIFSHMELNIAGYNMGEKMLPSILVDLETNPAYSYLWNNKEFSEIIKKYKKKN